MANLFEIAPINPIRLVKIESVSDRYFYPSFDGALLANSIPDFKQSACYFQKFRTDDLTTVQILSDFEDITCKVYDYTTGYEAVIEIEVVDKASAIGQTFKVYEASFDFSLLPEGYYYVIFSYENEDLEIIEWQSEPLDIKVEHENTLLLEYTHSSNDYSFAFDTGTSFFNLRVEGAILDFKPEADKEIYNDQVRNSTLLNSVPYRSFTAYFGDAGGIPDWMADKLNRILSCDQVKYDGVFYQTSQGAKWEAKRAEDWPFTGWTIEITPIENKFILQILTGGQAPEGFTVVEKAKNYIGNTGDLVVAGIFRKYTLLKNISIYNYDGEFTLLVGTTPGGSEIGEFIIPAGASNHLVNWLFMAATTVYYTGLDGLDTDVLHNYLQYDEDPAGGINTNDLEKVPIGAVLIYEEPEAGDLLLDFDLGSGLGTVGRRYEKYAISDGRNGTTNRGGSVPIGYIDGDAELGTMGLEVGSNEYNLVVGQLPKFHVKLFTPEVAAASGPPTTNSQVARARASGSQPLNYEMIISSQPATLGKSSEVGNNEVIDNRQLSIVSLWIKKIA